MRQWLSGDGIHDLIFDELPYKVYSAKVTGTPQLKTLCFDKDGARVYKGEGAIQFTCYYPFAHTPTIDFDGREISNYNNSNISEWVASSGIGSYEIGQNRGDLPAPFIVESVEVKANDKFRVGELEIIIKEDCTNLKWDSKTGLVVGKINEATRPIRYEGTSYGTIPVGGISKINISYESNNILINANKEKYIDGIKQQENANLPFSIKYSYWYY